MMSLLHKDQENHAADLQKNKSNVSKLEPHVQKRTVFGMIDSNIERNVNKSKNKVPTSKQAGGAFSFIVHEDKQEHVKEPKKLVKTGKLAPKIEKVIEVSNKTDDAKLEHVRRPLNVIKVNCENVNIFSESNDDDVKSKKSDSDTASLDVVPMSIEKSAVHTKSKVEQKSGGIFGVFDLSIYSGEILTYLKELELNSRPKANYMRRQPDVTHVMRTVLVDWLVEVVEEYKMHTQTLYLAVSFIDKFLSLMSVVRGKLQLLGTAAMFVASKCEEIYPPEVQEFVYITDDTYTVKQVLRMEYLILKVLGFDVSSPTIITFLTHFSVLLEIPERELYLAMYLSELVILNGDPFLQFVESVVASSAIAVSRHCLGYSNVWPSEYAAVTGYQLSQLAACIRNLTGIHACAKELAQKAVNNKYASNKYLNVSDISPQEFDVTEYVLQMKDFGCNLEK